MCCRWSHVNSTLTTSCHNELLDGMNQKDVNMILSRVVAGLLAALTCAAALAADLPIEVVLDGTASYKANINVIIQGKDEDGVEQFAADIGYAFDLQVDEVGVNGNCRNMRATLNNIVVRGKMKTDSREGGSIDTNYAMPSLSGTAIDFCLNALGNCASYRFVDPVLQDRFENPAQSGPEAKTLAAIAGGLDQYLFFPYPDQKVVPGGSWQTHVNEPVDAGLVNVVVDYDLLYNYNAAEVTYAAANVDLKLGSGFMAMMFKDSSPEDVRLEMSGKYKLDPESGLVDALDADELIAFVVRRSNEDGSEMVFDLKVNRAVAVARQ